LTPSPARSILITIKCTAYPAEYKKLDLKKLEERVDELIQTVERLRGENKSLRESQTNLVSERDKLMTKTEQARVRVESMIERLRTMENEQ
jgi:cell division protein ZapB